MIKYFIIIVFVVVSCVPGPIEEGEGRVIGKVGVSLNATKEFIRKEEAPIGNMLADAIKSYLKKKEIVVDLAVMNAGGIRFDNNNRPNGIYESGEYTEGTIREILPRDDVILIKEVTGKELKAIFEHSVSLLPKAKGNFLQVSKGVIVTVDKNEQAEVLNIKNTEIVTIGSRIKSIEVDGSLIEETRNYKIASTSYIIDGGDNFITLKNIKNKIFTQFYIRNILKEYILEVERNPIIEGRIVFK